MAEMNFPKSQIDFHKCWSSVAGRLEGLKWAHSMLSTNAGFYFAQGDDNRAKIMRDAANQLQKHIDTVSKELDSYIKESEKRNV